MRSATGLIGHSGPWTADFLSHRHTQPSQFPGAKYGFALTAGLSIGLGLAAQLARILLTEVGHGEPDDRVDLDLGEVREVTFDARALRVAVSPARSGSSTEFRRFGRRSDV
jgi:hypothetical protein